MVKFVFYCFLISDSCRAVFMESGMGAFPSAHSAPWNLLTTLKHIFFPFLLCASLVCFEKLHNHIFFYCKYRNKYLKTKEIREKNDVKLAFSWFISPALIMLYAHDNDNRFFFFNKLQTKELQRRQKFSAAQTSVICLARHIGIQESQNDIILTILYTVI